MEDSKNVFAEMKKELYSNQKEEKKEEDKKIKIESKLEKTKEESIKEKKGEIMTVNLDNIKSQYILKKIFENINTKKLLELVKYNKKIKNRLDISLNNYKEYSEKYSKIEIEVIPGGKGGKFININNKNEKRRIIFMYILMMVNTNKENLFYLNIWLSRK